MNNNFENIELIINPRRNKTKYITIPTKYIEKYSDYNETSDIDDEEIYDEFIIYYNGIAFDFYVENTTNPDIYGIYTLDIYKTDKTSTNNSNESFALIKTILNKFFEYDKEINTNYFEDIDLERLDDVLYINYIVGLYEINEIHDIYINQEPCYIRYVLDNNINVYLIYKKSIYSVENNKLERISLCGDIMCKPNTDVSMFNITKNIVQYFINSGKE